jgi:MtN3 and saliva related transmembrane protein
MNGTELLGYLAGVLTTFAVVPQIRKAWKTRCADDISVFTVVMLICGLSLWTAYGVVTQAWPIIVTNGIAVLLQLFLLRIVFYDRRIKNRGNQP